MLPGLILSASAPDRAAAVARVKAAAVTVQIGAIAIAGETWTTNIITGDWEPATEDLSIDPAGVVGFGIRCVSFDFGAVNGYVSEFDHPKLSAQQHALGKQQSQFFEIVFSKIADGTEIGPLPSSEEYKSNIFLQGIGDLARTEDTSGISVE